MKKAELDSGKRAGVPTDVADKLKMLERENRELRQAKLGVLAITAIEKNDACDGTIFDPTNLAAGLSGPTEHPLFTARQPAYAISITNRF